MVATAAATLPGGAGGLGKEAVMLPRRAGSRRMALGFISSRPDGVPKDNGEHSRADRAAGGSGAPRPPLWAAAERGAVWLAGPDVLGQGCVCR